MSQNTLYYHFDGLLDIAKAAVEAELSEEIAHKMLGSATEDGQALLVSNPRDSLRLSRIGLVASSESARLTSMLIGMLKAAWCGLSNRTPDSLTKEESMDLDFIYGGLVSILADPTIREDMRNLADFLARPLGKGITAAMTDLFPVPSPDAVSH